LRDDHNSSSVSSSTWGSIFATLSFDAVQPYLPEAGLQLPVESNFLSTLRGFIRQFSLADPSFPAAVFEWLGKGYDRRFREHLRIWGGNVFIVSARADAFLWASLIRHGIPDAAPDLQTEPEFIRLVRRKLIQLRRPPIPESGFFTEWDLELSQREEYGGTANPLDYVSTILAHLDFVESWHDAERALGNRIDMEAVEWWGVQVAERLGMPLDDLGKPGPWPLPPPPWR
jgi:hypothetical protein